MSLPPWNVEDDGEGKRGDDIARQGCSGRVGPEAILSWATESLVLILVIKILAVHVGTDTDILSWATGGPILILMIKMVAVHVGNDTDTDTELGDREPDFDL